MATYSTRPDPLAYYSPEAYLFSDVGPNFRKNGQLHPEAFYLILDWKAPRARTRHVRRLARATGTFDKAVSGIAADIYNVVGPDERLRVLMTKWGFLLPTASAILTVLYPTAFTVYDRRLCASLGRFSKLANMKWSNDLWEEYQRFTDVVRIAAPTGLSLRDCDRWLWGRDKRQTMLHELMSAGKVTAS
jgi:hypothetical protein